MKRRDKIVWVILHHRYWPFIDDALRVAAFERKVKVRMLVSCGRDSDPAMLPFLKSLASMDSPRHHISIQVVRYDDLSLRQRRNPWFYFSFMFECLSFFLFSESVHYTCRKPD